MREELKNHDGKIYCTLEYWPETEIVYVDWTGFLPLNEVKTGANRAIELMKHNNASKLLNNTFEFRSAWDESYEWVFQDAMPRAINAGMKRMAHVAPPFLFEQLIAKIIRQRSIARGDAFLLKIFDDKESALSWLLS